MLNNAYEEGFTASFKPDLQVISTMAWASALLMPSV
jgi:hypothetical protein